MEDKIKYILRLLIIIMLNVFIIALLGTALFDAVMPDAAPTLSRMGSRGDEVRAIQQRLLEDGYYTGEVDGIFGSGTAGALKEFQRAQGLSADGVAGPQTLAALGLGEEPATGGATADSDYQLLARMISAEARAEPFAGQVAVGAVLLNRVEHPSFPDTLAGVVYQPGAFSSLGNGQVNQPVSESAYRAAQEALNGADPSGGAIYFYNPAKTTNKFMHSRPVITTIGAHRFCS